MKKEKMMMMVIFVLLIGAIAAGGILTIWHFHTADASEESAPAADLDPVKGVHYSCSGGSDSGQSFYFSLQKEGERILFSCEYFETDRNGGAQEKYMVEDAVFPAESFAELIRLVESIEFPDESQEADDEVIALDAATYSLTVYYTSGKRSCLEKYFGISEIDDFFHKIKTAEGMQSNE